MKYTAVAALGILALASCNKEGHVADSSRFITVEAQIGDMTKATYNGNKSAFAAGDDLSLFAWTGSKTAIPADLVVDGVVNTLGTDGKTWTPKTQMLWADVDIPHYFMAVSPAREVKSFTADPFTLEPAAAKYQQSDLLIAVNDKGLTAENNPVQLTFDHAMAKLNVNLTFRDQWTEAKVDTLMVEAKKSATIDYIKKAVTATGEAATVGMNRVSDASWTTLMVPQTGFRSISINVSGNGTYQFNATEDIPLQSGKVTTVNLIVGRDQIILDKAGVTITDWAAGTVINNGEAQIATDLSMVDCAGNARAEGKAWTANCYMVHTAGYYKLPLVYGNAIKDGAVNDAAYTGVENDNATKTFPNHAGTAISAPWITKAATGTGVNKGMGITVSKAELLWQDAEGLITKVGIDGDYLTLTVGKDAATQEGNAVIAAKASDGTVVWSWHIWVTKETFATLTSINTGDHTYQVTPVNLGWVATGGEGKQGYNTYYQWGRKDAFIPSVEQTNASPNTNHTVYDIENGTVTGITFTESTTATIADNIKNPTTHNHNSDNHNPCTDMYYNMWDAQNTVTGNVTTATVKTVYDPCPPGFCVPTSNLYYYMGDGNDGRSDSNWDGTNKGQTWKQATYSSSTTGPDLFFPASGIRWYNDGMLRYVGSCGFYWSASPLSSYRGRDLDFNYKFSGWRWNSYSRAYGFPVRAVAEESSVN